ncbi:MAG TPA: GNAT family N-acetyltransferase [Actinopolymorphaceae bacterium]
MRSADPGIRIEPLAVEHEAEVLAFELANRAFFARTIGDRGDEYFAAFPRQHAERVAENEAGTCMMFVVRDAGGALVGRVNLVDVEHGSATLGYRFAEAATGRGYAKAAVALALEVAVRRAVSTVTAMTTVDNLASRRVLTVNGFEEQSSGSPSSLTIDGEEKPIVHYRRTLA